MTFVVALVDDDAGFRQALQWLLDSSGYDVRCYDSLAAFIDGHDPRAIGCSLIDLRLGEDSGMDAMKQARLKGHDAPALMISAYGDIPTAVLAVRGGAYGFIEKPTDNDKLLAAVAEACERHATIRRGHGAAVDAVLKYQKLTDREADVYWELVAGAATKEIAARLCISTRTAETHRGRVFEKFAARGLDDIVQTAFHIKPVYRPDSA